MRLIFTSGIRQGNAVDIDGAGLMFGRVEDNDIQLADEKVSRHHAVIEREDGGRLVLRDLNSRNGTYVDGVRLSGPHELTGGERLRLGDAHFLVEAKPAAPVAPTQPTPVAPTPPTPVAPPPLAAPRAAGLRRYRVALPIGALILALIGVGQIVLPGMGESSLRSDLSKYGPVRHVNVESLPAIKLLWHRADRVDVTMDSYRSEPRGHGSLADFLSRTRATAKLDAHVGLVDAQLVTLHDVHLHKDGDALVGEAGLTQRDLSAALPTFLDIRPVSSSENGIVVRALASAFGKRVRVRLRILANDGKVVVQPEGVPFGSLAKIKVFGDPRVHVERLGAQLRRDRYLLTARARLK